MSRASIALRTWLVILALFEIPPIVVHLIGGAPLDMFGAGLGDSASARRVWCFMLALLVCSRVLAATCPSRGVAMHCAVVHILEAVVLITEAGVVGDFDNKQLLCGAIIANAVLLSGWALSFLLADSKPESKPAHLSK